MAVIISYQPWYVGDTYPVWEIPLTTDGGIEDITGLSASNFKMFFHTPGVSPDTPGTGTFAIQTVYPAVVLYTPSATDVAAAFNGDLVVKSFWPPNFNATSQAGYDPIQFEITAA